MIELIVGLKGTGKTKTLIKEVNRVAKETHGAVVCIEYGRKLNYDIKYLARLVDAKEYGIDNAEQLFGFVCGILAANYDITEIFIDSALKICGNNIPEFEEFLLKINGLLKRDNIKCLITATIDPDDVPPSIAGFIREVH